MRSKLYAIHNTTDKVARGEVSLHLNAFACPSPIKERKWGWIWRVSPGRVPPSKATLIDVFFDVDSKYTIGFRRSRLVFEIWRFKITRKNLPICKKYIKKKIKIFLFNY